jgi:hypothetical protein
MKEGEGAQRLKRRGSKDKGRSGDNFKRRQASVNMELDHQSLFGFHVQS